MDWKTLLAYITGSVDQELLLRNEYLVMENRLLRKQITSRVRLNDSERKTFCSRAQEDHDLDGMHPHPHGRARGHRLLYR